jgi:hypothetical protein
MLREIYGSGIFRKIASRIQAAKEIMP